MRNDRNAFGVLFLQTWKNMPFALLLLSGALQSISDDTLDAARDLGANIYRRYSDIIIPGETHCYQITSIDKYDIESEMSNQYCSKLFLKYFK